MNRRPFRFVLPALVACSLGSIGYVAWPSRARAPEPRAARAMAGAESAPAPARPAARPAEKARYRLSSEHRAWVEGEERVRVVVEGVWTTTERAEGRVEVAFAATRIEASGDEPPSAADVARPFVLETRDGLLTAIGFPEATPRAGRGLLTSLATTLQVTSRPGDAWTVQEEDLTGRYLASYTRAGDKVVRKRTRYTELRGRGGLDSERAGTVVPEELSEIVFDARGVVSATVRIVQTYASKKGLPSVKTTLTATLRREDAEEVPLTAGPSIDPEPIRSYVDHERVARKRNEALLAGAKAPELVAEAKAVAHLDRKEAGASTRRAATLRRLEALVEVAPESAGALAAAIRAAPADGATVRLLAGSLASAAAPTATAALASLLDDTLPDDARSSVLTSLALARSPTADSAAALSRALDKPLGDQAAFALGAQARGLGDDGAGGDAVDQLLQRYADATTPADKRTYLLALGNTGSRKALEVMQAAIAGSDVDLARIATRGLRLIPGDDVDDLLLSLIQSGSYLVFDAIQAAGYRSPALWQPRLKAAEVEYKGQKRVTDAIEAVLVRWANLASPPAP